jgi:catechol-2,3-dioxygenase
MIPVKRINHAVLYVRDAAKAAAFYQEAFGFEVVAELPGAAFLRSPTGGNHHDLGLFAVGPNAQGPVPGQVGLYHLAWEVPEITDLVDARATLERMGALVGASDHGTSKSLYGRDVDGNEFEIMWAVPPEEWGEHEHAATVAPLDLEAEVARHG